MQHKQMWAWFHSPVLADAQGAMGEADAHTYDDDDIFRHLVFYVDTCQNAASNGLEESKPVEAVTER